MQVCGSRLGGSKEDGQGRETTRSCSGGRDLPQSQQGGGDNASCGDAGFLMHLMLGRGTAWSALLAALLILLSSQQAAAQKSVPVTTTQGFAQALQDQTITEIILDPSGTGVRPSPIPASAGKRVL